MRRFLTVLFKATLALLGIGIIALLLVWLFPSLVLNSYTLGLSRVFLSKKEVILTWKNGSLSSHSVSWNRKEISLSLKDFCLKVESEGIEGCFPKVEAVLQVGLKKSRPVLFELGPVDIQSSSLVIAPPARSAANEEKKEGSLSSFDVPDILSELHPNQLQAAFDSIELKSGDLHLKGGLSFSAEEKQGKTQYALDAKAKNLKDAANSNIELKAILTGVEKDKFSNWDGNLKLKAIQGRGNLYSQINIQGSSALLKGDWSLQSTLHLPVLDKVAFDSCPFSWNKQAGDKLQFTCQANTSLVFPTEVDIPYQKLLKDINVKIGIEAERKDTNAPLITKIEVLADPFLKPLHTGKGILNIELAGNVSQFPKNWNYTFDSKLELEQFKRLVSFFSTTSWAIPQPFSTLDGKILVAMQGKGDLESKKSSFPFQLETQLSSKNQKLFAKIDNTLEIVPDGENSKTVLTTKALLNDVTLVLPPLMLAAPPRILPDSRILTSESNAKKKEAATQKSSEKDSSFVFNFSLQTHDAPLYLISKTKDMRIPVKLRMESSEGKPLQGEVVLHPFETEMFKRKAQVKYLNIHLKEKPELNEIRSEINVVYTDYTVSILINGLLDHPEVELMSTPPLPQKQLIAVLLFGRSLDQLEPDQVSSVGNTQAAITEGVIGMASLYALASTPIESVGYDQGTRVFTAKIKLQDGTSMNIGTDMSTVRKLGIRKRLGSNWFINTYLENPFLSAERSVTGFLEWNWRY